MSKKLVLGITISGSTPLIKGQSKYFKSLGYDVYLLCPKDEKSVAYCAEEGCQLLDVNIERYISPLKDILTILQIWRILKNVNPDIVNVGTPKMGLLGIIAAYLAGVKNRIYTCRGLRYEHETGFSKKLLYSTEKFAGKLARKIICVGPSLKDKALSDNVFNENKCVVIGKGSSNGVVMEQFNPSNVSTDSQKQVINDLNLADKFVFGFVGRLVDRKGVAELYDAFNKINKKYPSTKLIMLGKKDFSQLTPKHLVGDIIQHKAIEWLGWQDDVPLYLSVCDVCVMPSWWEGFGNVFIQAAAMGLPVIGTNGTGCSDAISPGFNSLMVSIKDKVALFNAMEEYLLDESKRKEHASNSLKWASNFRQEAIWSGIDNLYKSLQ